MVRFLIHLIVTAAALWVTTLIVSGVHLAPYASDGPSVVLSYLLVALIFAIVNAVIGRMIRIVAFPLYILTLGLISFVVNGLLLMLVAWISGWFGFGLVIDNVGWGILGALVLGIVTWLLGIILRPFTRRH